MAKREIGTVIDWRALSPVLATFRLLPADGDRFPDYEPGQYIALRRDDCRLSKREVGSDGQRRFVPLLDGQGRPRRGPVTHAYSIASAPWQTRDAGHLEFYVVLETDEQGDLGRLTESMFRMPTSSDGELTYVCKITGDFTLAKRAAGFSSVLLVGTGTGLAPFVSMVRQLHHDAGAGPPDGVRYTLLHTNRTHAELAFHDELVAIEAERRFDFVYVPTVSRPAAGDLEQRGVGSGRANNLLRHLVGMPLREEQLLGEAEASGPQAVAAARAGLERAVRPRLPGRLDRAELARRLDPAETVVLTCGNPALMADIETIAVARGMRFEKEDW